jgi:hypothetical protein
MWLGSVWIRRALCLLLLLLLIPLGDDYILNSYLCLRSCCHPCAQMIMSVYVSIAGPLATHISFCVVHAGAAKTLVR